MSYLNDVIYVDDSDNMSLGGKVGMPKEPMLGYFKVSCFLPKKEEGKVANLNVKFINKETKKEYSITHLNWKSVPFGIIENGKLEPYYVKVNKTSGAKYPFVMFNDNGKTYAKPNIEKSNIMRLIDIATGLNFLKQFENYKDSENVSNNGFKYFIREFVGYSSVEVYASLKMIKALETINVSIDPLIVPIELTDLQQYKEKGNIAYISYRGNNTAFSLNNIYYANEKLDKICISDAMNYLAERKVENILSLDDKLLPELKKISLQTWENDCEYLNKKYEVNNDLEKIYTPVEKSVKSYYEKNNVAFTREISSNCKKAYLNLMNNLIGNTESSNNTDNDEQDDSASNLSYLDNLT